MVTFVSSCPSDGKRGTTGEAAAGVVGLLRDRRRSPGGSPEKFPPPQPPTRDPDGREVAGRLPADPTLRVFVRWWRGGRRRGRVIKLKQGECRTLLPPLTQRIFRFFPDTDKLWKPSGEDRTPKVQIHLSPDKGTAAPPAHTGIKHMKHWDWQTPQRWGENQGLQMQITFLVCFEFSKCKGISIDVNACCCFKKKKNIRKYTSIDSNQQFISVMGTDKSTLPKSMFWCFLLQLSKSWLV